MIHEDLKEHISELEEDQVNHYLLIFKSYLNIILIKIVL